MIVYFSSQFPHPFVSGNQLGHVLQDYDWLRFAVSWVLVRQLPCHDDAGD